MSIRKFAASLFNVADPRSLSPFRRTDLQAYFDVGDTVKLCSGSTGTITKLNPKNAVVDCNSDGVWNAPYLGIEICCGATAAGRLSRAERLWEVAAEARGLMDSHGLADWKLNFSTAKRSLGACHYKRQLILLNLRHAFRGMNAEVRDTILHEIAHALAGPKAGHGPEWKKTAERLGALPRRCAPESESIRLAGTAAKADLQAGDWVSFIASGSRHVGRIVKKNSKTATVEVVNQGLWRVSYTNLTKEADPRPPIAVPAVTAAGRQKNDTKKSISAI